MASRGLLSAGDFCTEAAPVAPLGLELPEVMAQGLALLAVKHLGMCWGEVLGPGGVVRYWSSFALFEQRGAS